MTTTNPRADRARFLLADSGQWLRLRSRETGKVVAYAIPSAREPGQYWTTNGQRCDCPDFMFRGLIYGDCKHVRAARLYIAQQRKEQAA
jgi:predicted nucleic acid-binding Zn finger protein